MAALMASGSPPTTSRAIPGRPVSSSSSASRLTQVGQPQRHPPSVLYQAHEVLTAGGSQGKLVSERSRPGSARSAFHATQAASTTAS